MIFTPEVHGYVYWYHLRHVFPQDRSNSKMGRLGQASVFQDPFQHQEIVILSWWLPSDLPLKNEGKMGGVSRNLVKFHTGLLGADDHRPWAQSQPQGHTPDCVPALKALGCCRAPQRGLKTCSCCSPVYLLLENLKMCHLCNMSHLKDINTWLILLSMQFLRSPI